MRSAHSQHAATAAPATTLPPPAEGGFDTAALMAGLYGPGIIGCKGAFSPAWADRMCADIEALFAQARARPDGALARGPQRWYVEAPAATRHARRLDSLAFNLTAVDTTAEMGPLEIAPGTQWDDWMDGGFGGLDVEHADREAAMFPPASWWPRYAARAETRMPQRGDMSARSALTVHRGTANRSQHMRPVLVVGVDAPDARNGARHDLQATPGWLAGLPAVVRQHLPARVVETLQPIRQVHGIAGLMA